MSVTSAVTPVRIVCANTLGVALRGADTARTFRMKHTAGIDQRWEEARRVLQLTVNYEERFQKLGDELGRQKFTANQFRRVLDEVFPEDADTMGARQLANRRDAKSQILTIFNGGGEDGDTTGNAPGTKWTAFNAVGEWSDWYRRYQKNTDQMVRSFEDASYKQTALDALIAA